MKRILCFFGIHEWAMTRGTRQPCRVCYNCDREQMGVRATSSTPVIWVNVRQAP